jgi:fatty acid desaturase
MLFFELWHLRVAGYRYLFLKKPTGWIRELALTSIHLTAYAALWFMLLSPLWALVFIALHHGLIGMYLGSVFATNHKGMPTVDETSDFFTTQVLTTRNIRGGKLVAFLYGGLNFQIEHHLFPGAPRNNLRKIKEIVTSFCAQERIPYHETSPLQSYREIFTELKKISAPLRAG